MIEEVATVKSINKTAITVETIKESSCGGCAQKSSCSTSVLDKYFANKQIEMELESDIPLSIGDRVKVGLDEAVFVRLTLLVYFLPLCVMIAFAFIGQAISSYLLLEGELLVVMLAVVAFIACFYSLKVLIKKKLTPESLRPVILRRLSI